MALRIIRSREEAEDVVQDVMLKVWSLCEKWETVIHKEAFCCTMVRNLSLSRLELKINQGEDLKEQQDTESSAEIPVEQLEREESRDIDSYGLCKN